MSYRDDRERRAAEIYHDKKRRSERNFAIAVIILLALYATSFLMVLYQTGSTYRNDEIRTPLAVSFGLSRVPLTRSTVVVATVVESPAPADRTAIPIASVTLQGDPLKNKECPCNEFPGQQIVLSISPFDPTSATVTMVVNPWAPERVPPGLYTGGAVVELNGQSQTLPISISLDGRDDLSAVSAFLAVLTGASMGIVVKWITERLTPQAAAYRRLVGLRRAVGWGFDGRDLPLTYRIKIEELEELVLRQDYDKVERYFHELEVDRAEIAIAATNFGLLYGQLDSQAKTIDVIRKGDQRTAEKLDAIVDDEYRRLLSIQATWISAADRSKAATSKGQQADALGSPDAIVESEAADSPIEKLREKFVLCGRVIGSVAARVNLDEDLKKAVEALHFGKFDLAKTLWEKRDRDYDSQLDTATQNDAEHRLPAQSSRWREWKESRALRKRFRGSAEPTVAIIYQYARLIAGLASVIAVSLVGFKLQYLDNQAFDGTWSAWVMLVLWGFAVELSGVSILDVLSRLSSSSPATSPANLVAGGRSAPPV